MRFVLAALGVATTILHTGCGNTPRRAAAPPSILISVDTSRSQTDKEIKQSFGAVFEAVNKVLPRKSRVLIWRFDDDAELQYEGQPERDVDLAPVRDEILGDRKRRMAECDRVPSRRIHTNLSTVLNENLEELRRLDQAGRESALILLWDGEDAYPERARNLVKHFASFKHLKAVWVIGVVPGTGQNLARQVREIFESLDNRLVVSSLHDRSDGLRRFKQLIQQSGKEGQ